MREWFSQVWYSGRETEVKIPVSDVYIPKLSRELASYLAFVYLNLTDNPFFLILTNEKARKTTGTNK